MLPTVATCEGHCLLVVHGGTSELRACALALTCPENHILEESALVRLEQRAIIADLPRQVVMMLSGVLQEVILVLPAWKEQRVVFLL